MTGERRSLPRAAARALVASALVVTALAVPAVTGGSTAVSAPAPVTPVPHRAPRAVVTVRAAQRVVVHAPVTSLRGSALAVTGALRPVRRNAAVTLQRAVGARWVSVTSGRTRADGTFRLTDRPLSGSAARYRVVAAPTRTLSAATSGVRTVRLQTSGLRYALRPGTVQLPASAVVEVVDGADRTVDLAPGVAAPAVGAVVLVPPVAGAPDGLMDLVAARAYAAGHWTLTTRPASIADAFSEFTVTQHLTGLVEASRALGDPAWQCASGVTGPSVLPTFTAPDLAVDVVVDASSGIASITVTGDQVTTWDSNGYTESCYARWPDVRRVVATIVGVPVVVRTSVQVSPERPADPAGVVTTHASIAATLTTGRTGAITVVGDVRGDATSTVTANGFDGFAWSLQSGITASVSVAEYTPVKGSFLDDVRDNVVNWMTIPSCHTIDGGLVVVPSNGPTAQLPRHALSDACSPPPDSPGVHLELAPLTGPPGFAMTGSLTCPAPPAGEVDFWFAVDDGHPQDSGYGGSLGSDGLWHFDLALSAPSAVGVVHRVFFCQAQTPNGSNQQSIGSSRGVEISVTQG